MHNKANFNSHQGQLFTDTYLSSISQAQQRQPYDKNIFKAIKENNVEIIVEKDRQVTLQMGQLYDEEKELTAIVMDMRKKYDLEKIVSSEKEKNIQKLEEQHSQLETDISTLSHEFQQTKDNYQAVLNKCEESAQAIEDCIYKLDVRLNLEDRLKQDILFYKKKCFDLNIKLVRTRTYLKQINKRSDGKKTMKSKCNLVLNSLQQTVILRQNERQNYLKQMETMLVRKYQNNQIKTNRQNQLQSSMIKALSDRLPEEKLLTNTYYCEIFLRIMLRNKMQRIMQQNKEIQAAFNKIKKQTRIETITEFVNDFLNRQKIYGDLLDSIQKAQQKIQKLKEQRTQLDKQKIKLETVMSDFENNLNHEIENNQNQNLNKQLKLYQVLVPKCKENQIMLKRWAVKTIVKFNNMTQKIESNHKIEEQTETYNKLTIKEALRRALKLLIQDINKNQPQNSVINTPLTMYDLSTDRSDQKINLPTMTSQSVLSKQYSKRNFRVRTMTTHEQAHEERDHQYDDLSEYDFLKHNRRMVKKDNKAARPRIKTRPF